MCAGAAAPAARAAARTGARESRSPSVAGLSAVSFLRDERSVPSGSAARRAQGMVKSVVVASSIEATFEARAASAATAASVEWGFLVGQAATSTHSKDYVLAIVPATESEGISSDDLVDQASQVRIASKFCCQHANRSFRVPVTNPHPM